MTRISLLHPSRGRPEKSLATDKYWIDRAGNVEIELIVSIDANDQPREYLSVYSNGDPIISMSERFGDTKEFYMEAPWKAKFFIISGDNSCVVEATNKAAERSTGDILVYLSDDFKCPENWGELLVREFEEDRPLLVKVDDCLQKFDVPVLTIPIMNRALYERLGYFWHPEYKSMAVDEDLYWTAKKLNAMKLAPHLAFPHEHPANGKAPDDETYRRSAANWDQGQAVFRRRKAAGFPI